MARSSSRIFLSLNTSCFAPLIQFLHVTDFISILFDLQFGHVNCDEDIAPHERHLMHVCSCLQERLRSFASISKIRSAPFQSFSYIGRFGNE